MKPSILISILIYIGFIFFTYFNLRYMLIETLVIWYCYILLTSFIVIRFIEKESFIKRMGLSGRNIALTSLVSILGVSTVFYFNGPPMQYLPDGIFTPFIEEVFFRGFLIFFLSKALKEKENPPWKSLFIVSVLFSVTHALVGMNLPSLFFAFMLAVTSGLLYSKFNTILFPFILHMTWNLATSFYLTLIWISVLIFSCVYTIYIIYEILVIRYTRVVLPRLRNIGQALKKQKKLGRVLLIIALLVLFTFGMTRLSEIRDGIGLVLSVLLPMSEALVSNSSLPSVIQNLGLALLGILIPLAIAVLTDLFHKKSDEKEGLYELDIQVILNHVFRIKRLLIYGILNFLPFIFWENSPSILRVVEMALSLIGSSLIVKTILNVYKWTRGKVYPFRFSYLKGLKNPEDMEVAWRSVWLSKGVDAQNERFFFNIFSSKIDGILTKYEKRYRKSKNDV